MEFRMQPTRFFPDPLDCVPRQPQRNRLSRTAGQQEKQVLTRKRLQHTSNRWLTLIAVYKLLQAMLLISVGLGALRLMHRDIANVFLGFVTEMRVNTDGRLVSYLLDKAATVDDPMLRRITTFVFVYAGLGLLEGIGLYLEKVWAEYFTAIITASFLPLEVMEILHRVTWVRLGLFVANLGVFLYLLAHLRNTAPARRQARRAAHQTRAKRQG